MALFLVDGKYVSGGCISSIDCGRCGKKYVCDTNRAGQEIDGITYIYGPCCCGYICECYREEWEARLAKVSIIDNTKFQISCTGIAEYQRAIYNGPTGL